MPHKSRRSSPLVSAVRPINGSNTLVAYFCAEAAAAMERRTDAELREHTLAMLSAMYSAETVAAARLVEFHVRRWAADEYACGSYSYLPVGAAPSDRRLLARAEGTLFFAGEATSHGAGAHADGGHPSTVHGALISGTRAAAEALGWLRSQSLLSAMGRGDACTGALSDDPILRELL